MCVGYAAVCCLRNAGQGKNMGRSIILLFTAFLVGVLKG